MTLRELIEVIPKEHILCISDNTSVIPQLPMTGDKVHRRCAKLMDFTVVQVVAMDKDKIFIELEGGSK